MAGANILFPKFRDEQLDSKYPFADSATLQSTGGNVTLAKDLFIDASFYPIGGGSAIYISSIIVAANKVTVFAKTVSPVVTISAQYDPLSLTDDTLLFYDEHSRPAGVVIFNKARIYEIYQWGFGTYTFTRAASEIVATAFIPAQEPGVRALTVNEQGFITDDVWFVGDNGVVLRAEAGNVIRVDTVGVPLFNRAACDEAQRTKPTPRLVATINNCTADEFGNFTITATNRGIEPANSDTTVLRVYPTNYALVIEAAGRSEI